MRGCRSAVGAVFYFCLVFPILLCVLSLLAIRTWAFNRDFYIELLDSPTLYTSLWDEETLVTDSTSREIQIAQARIATASLTPDYVRGEVSRLVNHVFDFIEGKTPVLDLSIHLAPLKSDLLDNGGANRTASVVVAELPPCPAERSNQASGGGFLTCLPPDWSEERAQSHLRDQIMQWARTFDDTLTFAPPITAEDFQQSGWQAISQFNMSIAYLLVIGLLSWLVNGMIASGDRRGLWLWLGWMLFIPSALILTMGVLIATPQSEAFVTEIIAEANSGNVVLATELTTIATEILRAAAFGFIIVGSLGSVLSAGLILIGLRAAPQSIPTGRTVTIPLASGHKPAHDDRDIRIN